MKNWLVIANAARARVLEEADVVGQYAHVADLVHPESRMKGEQLSSDRPGHVEGIGHGLGNASYAPRTDPRVREHARFAHEVASVLNQGIAEGRCAGLVLVASDPFLGLLKAQLNVQSHKYLLRTVASDFTLVPDTDLAARLHTTES